MPLKTTVNVYFYIVKLNFFLPENYLLTSFPKLP